MLKYMENLYEVRVQRKNICYIKDGVMYFKWAFPTAKGGFNPTYAEKVNKTILKISLPKRKTIKLCWLLR